MIPRVTVTARRDDAQTFASIASLIQLGRLEEAWQWFEREASGEKGPMINVGGKSATVGFGVSSGGVEDAVLSAGETYYVNMRSLVVGNWPAAYEIQWPR